MDSNNVSRETMQNVPYGLKRCLWCSSDDVEEVGNRVLFGKPVTLMRCNNSECEGSTGREDNKKVYPVLR